jgi:2-deoxy-D-gluconate 3-dehydrogenase
LGQAIAIGLAEAGANIAAVGQSRSFDQTKEAVEGVGQGFLGIHADLSAEASANSILEEAWERFGSADILVNNAAAQRRRGALEFEEADWDHLLAVNLKGPYFLSRQFAKRLIAAGRGGKIVNVSSLLCFQGGYGVAAYTATKGALTQLTKALSNELAPLGFNVNAIAPGYFRTEMNQALLSDPIRLPQISVRIPAGRWGEPEDLKGAAVFLASGASDYVHAHVLTVDGGWMSR